MSQTDRRRQRVILNTDAANEADDQYAIVHALLSPTLDTSLVAAQWGNRRSHTSLADSRLEIDRLLTLMGRDDVVVADGAPTRLPDERTPVDSQGARLIIDQAMLATPDDPVQIGFLGPLTDMASAILLEPAIVDKAVTVIWIGGRSYDDEPGQRIEFNLSNDIHAANVVFDSGIELWQVPSSVYTQTAVGLAELDARVAPHGELGRYLVDQVRAWNARWVNRPIEHRCLGDSPAVALMLNPSAAWMRTRPAPRFSRDGRYLPGAGHPIRVAETIDTRYLLEDMFHKIARHAAGRPLVSVDPPADHQFTNPDATGDDS